MSFFKRLFNRALREAHAAEAAGKLTEAAAAFAEAGEPAHVVRIHRARARSERDPWTRIEILRLAYSAAAADADPEGHRACALELAEVLREWVDAAGVLDRRDKALMEEAAQLFAEADQLEAAGDAWASIGYHQKAAEAYTQAGAVAKLERVFEAEESHQGMRTQRGRSVDEFAFAEEHGFLLEALGHIDDALAADPANPRVREVHARFHARLPVGGTLRVARRDGRGNAVLLSASPLTIGRDEHAHLPLLAPGISRIHAQLVREDVGFVIEDLGSRNGTAVDGAPCNPVVTLGEAGEIALGDRCTLDYLTTPEGVVLQPQIATMRETIFAWGAAWHGVQSHGLFPDGLALRLVDGYWHVDPAPGLAVAGKAWPQPMLLRYDDRIVLGELEIEVRR